MISPKHINFNDSVQALLSYEKARFAPYDLDEAETEPVVIESNETFDLLEVKLKLANGEEVIRHVKAYKNGESEVIVPEEPEDPTTPRLVLTDVPTGLVSADFVVQTALTPTEDHYITDVEFSRAGLSYEDFSDAIYFRVDADFYGRHSIKVTVKTNKGVEESFVVEMDVLNSMTFTVIDAPPEIGERTEVQLAYTPAEYTIDAFNCTADKPGVGAYLVTEHRVGIVVDPNLVADNTPLKITFTIDGVKTTFDTVFKKTELVKV